MSKLLKAERLVKNSGDSLHTITLQESLREGAIAGPKIENLHIHHDSGRKSQILRDFGSLSLLTLFTGKE